MILVFCYRLNFYPIFRDDDFYFRELTVPNAAQRLADDGFPENTLVYDDGAVKGFVTLDGEEIRKLFVEPCLWNGGIGSLLLEAAVSQGAGAIRFYERHGFVLTGRRKPEEDTDEMLAEMVRGE